MASVMREKKKTHGANMLWVDGAPQPNDYRYCTVENVVTSGQSIEEAKVRLAEDGYPIADMIDYVLVDRQQGGVERLRSLGYTVEPLFYLGDIAFVYGELELWTPEQVRNVQEEISAHHFR
jgi:orotate phosphoribosyltransferase